MNFCCSSARNVNGMRLHIQVRLGIHRAEMHHSPPSSIVSHDEVSEPSFRHIMEEILLPDICEFAVVWGNLGKNGLCG